MERETGLEPVTSSLGNQALFESKLLTRFRCEFLNPQRLAKSAFSKISRINRGTNEATLRTDLRKF